MVYIGPHVFRWHVYTVGSGGGEEILQLLLQHLPDETSHGDDVGLQLGLVSGVVVRGTGKKYESKRRAASIKVESQGQKQGGARYACKRRLAYVSFRYLCLQRHVYTHIHIYTHTHMHACMTFTQTYRYFCLCTLYV